MTTLFARQALLPTGWAKDVTIEITDAGRIGRVDHGNAVLHKPHDHMVGILLPAPVNAHSHAFQRAMAGLTEGRGQAGNDSFWTWRQLMYRFLAHLQPHHIEAITAFAQMEMLQAGFATCVEFHYLHHQPGGRPYANVAEMAERIFAAAGQSGIGLTLLPVHYQYGGCDKRALNSSQQRFGNTAEQFAVLFTATASASQSLPPDCRMGVAAHSLRAVAPEGLTALDDLAVDGPIHMHLAEQTAETQEVETVLGKRPVTWLLDNVDVNDRWCLIHCTHMLARETEALANTGAVAGLCPITEANLGDGIFDGVRWFNNDGAVAIGSDSNVRISFTEELRILEYSQRLRDQTRAALASATHATGRRLFDAVVAGGGQAAGRGGQGIAVGGWADLLSLDDSAPDLCYRTGDAILDCWIFAGHDLLIQDVWSAGRHCVAAGRHRSRDDISAEYKKAMRELEDTL